MLAILQRPHPVPSCPLDGLLRHLLIRVFLSLPHAASRLSTLHLTASCSQAISRQSRRQHSASSDCVRFIQSWRIRLCARADRHFSRASVEMDVIKLMMRCWESCLKSASPTWKTNQTPAELGVQCNEQSRMKHKATDIRVARFGNILSTVQWLISKDCFVAHFWWIASLARQS